MSAESMQRFSASFLDVFHTKTEIIGYAPSEEVFLNQVQQIKEKLVYYHKLFDIYHEYEGISNIKTINDHAGKVPVVVDPEIIQLLLLGEEMYASTNGKINIAMGSVLSIWHRYREKGREHPEEAVLPPMSELERAAKHTDIYRMKIDETMSSVYLEDEQMSLDVGGIGKGYAVQKTAEYAVNLGIKNMLFSVGGNVCAIGEKIDGENWKVGIQNPDSNSGNAFVNKVSINNLSIVTSGDYQRYYTVDEVKYAHIIDPKTLMPANAFASVTIITEDSGVADALSTAIYNMSLEEGKSYIDSLPGAEAMWIMKDGNVHYSLNFESYVDK